MGIGDPSDALLESSWVVRRPDQSSRRDRGLGFWDVPYSSRRSYTPPSEFKPHNPLAIVPIARDGLTEMVFEAEKSRYVIKETGKPAIYATVGTTQQLKGDGKSAEELAKLNKPETANAYCHWIISSSMFIQYLRIA